MRVTFDEFKQSMIGICDQKTIITTNPGYLLHIVLLCCISYCDVICIFLECQQAHNLYRYMQSLQLSSEWEDDIEGDLLFTVC